MYSMYCFNLLTVRENAFATSPVSSDELILISTSKLPSAISSAVTVNFFKGRIMLLDTVTVTKINNINATIKIESIVVKSCV